jgi:predicted esterase
VRRALLWVVLPVTLLVAAGLGVGGWYYSDQLLPAPPPWEPVPDLTVTAVDPEAGSLTIATSDGDAILPQVGFVSGQGLLAANGDPIVDGTDTTRTVTLLDGDWPQVGQAVATTVDTFWGDPATTLGLAFDTIDVASELGDLPAWRVVPRNAPTDDTWVVIVHGRGGALSEGNRLLPLLDELDLPSLTLSVRNDPDAPADPDGFGYFGEREWQEVEAAIDHLVEVEGADQVVLAGYSQGASSALSLLRRSNRADRVAGALLVSPLVSLDATLDLQARNRGIPGFVIPALLTSTRWISTWRSGLDFDQVEHAERAAELPADVPLLLTHGTADTTIPVGPTRELAALLGSQATYAEYEGVDHVREWNQDAAHFEADLSRLLEDVVG